MSPAPTHTAGVTPGTGRLKARQYVGVHPRHPDPRRVGECLSRRAAYVLQPAHVPLDVHPHRRQRVKAVLAAPAEENVQVGLGMDARLATVAAQEGRHRGS
ncbi:hypothetical protein GCM10010169_63430 [Micromonospora fulviviridis]|nr:hypothetical protein GCM10010169_63430 [Micromonospora fulviviridis]